MNIIGKVMTKEKMEFTTNLFEHISATEGKSIPIIEQNENGDCLCLFDNRYLIDVDHRDIKTVIKFPQFDDLFHDMIKELTK